MIAFIEKYWTYIITIGTVIAYLFDKGRTIWIEKKAKQVSYNRLFSSVLKLHFSYIKHTELYAEKPPMNIPDEMFIPMIEHIDTFSTDIDEFKKTIDRESDIVPEIIIQTHNLFDTIDRIRIVDRMQEKNSKNNIEVSESENIAVKRALFYAMSETFDDFFEDIILQLHKKSSSSHDFVSMLKHFKTDEYKEEVAFEQKKIMKRYYESLNRQGLIPNEVYNALLTEFKLKK
ncbi:hypothetical protein [Psychroserpens luteolus]|uniref:hypothetical protein n=1 Tax=Psychroserpens luteolus TaxID=2855840 RepID=UPI001E4EE8A3|nr:hypothetical protein [Psychroserpens luteolus]MCD2259132.1 hypothetical protein [Psychroserpens luteolus]